MEKKFKAHVRVKTIQERNYVIEKSNKVFGVETRFYEHLDIVTIELDSLESGDVGMDFDSWCAKTKNFPNFENSDESFYNACAKIKERGYSAVKEKSYPETKHK